MNARKAIFAGSWYPNRAAECEKEIKNFLKDPGIKAVSQRNLTGGIVPHAGWYFSGSIACNVIHCLREEKLPDVFVIFGTHLHADSPYYIMTEGAWETPFGEIYIEKALAAELVDKFTFTIETQPYYSQDNTIELQLPFIKYFFKDVRVVPISVPPTKNAIEIGQSVAEISTRLGLKVKVLGSTDLTHYGFNYGFTPKGTGPAAVDWVRNENDRRVIDAMMALDPGGVISEALENQNACCAGAVAAALSAAKQLGSDHAELIAYATSYDKSPGDNLVGYVGVVF